MSLHRCTEAECPFVGQTTSRSCRCHKTDEQVLKERVAKLEEQRDEMIEVLSEVREWIDGQIDVVDGPYGTRLPNKAMRFATDIDALIGEYT